MSFFREKVVIVTGSSNGIGRAAARAVAERGAKVTITGRSQEALEVTKRECIQAGASEKDIVEVIGDLENEETPKKIISATVEAFGQIDVLVNNAGLYHVNKDIELPVNEDIGVFDRLIRVNLRSVIRLSQLATPYLEKTKGSIVNVSSISALPIVQEDTSFYCLSKAALDSWTVQQAGHLIKKGIRVNSVNPGLIATDIIQKTGASAEQSKQIYDMLGSRTQAIPVGRCGTPEDVANLILFLADNTQSSFIIGQRIVIDGGSAIQNCLLSSKLL